MRESILHVLSSLELGGTQRVATALLQGSSRIRRNSFVLSLRPRSESLTGGGSIAADVAEMGVPLLELPSGTGWAGPTLWALQTLMRKHRTRAVVCYFFSKPHLWVHAAAVAAGVRVRISHVGSWPYDPRFRRRARLLLWLSRPLRPTLVGVSHTIAQELSRLGAYKVSRIAAIPNACDVPAIRAHADAARAERRSTGPLSVGMVARFDDAKDHPTLLRAFAALRDDFPGARLQLVGDGCRRHEMEQIADELGIGNAVDFLGTRTDVPQVLGSWDVFVLASHYEGLSIALIEAMAAGLPVIGSDIPAIREVLAKGDAGLLVAPGDIDGMASALRTLLGSVTCRERYAGRASQRVTAHYNLPAMVSRYEELLFG